MFTMIIAMQLATSIFFAVIWAVIALIIRWRAKDKVGKPAGIWARFVCLGFDFAVIYILFSILAYRGTLTNSVMLTVLIFFGYFFFFWLFLSATPGKMLAGITVKNKDGSAGLRVGGLLLRLVGYILMFFGWLWALGKKKRALHDIFAGTQVVYGKRESVSREGKEKIILLALLGVYLIIFISYFFHGLGEVAYRYAENDQLTTIDANSDAVPDVILLDNDGNGEAKMVKYDIDFDRIIDRTFYDFDEDGRTDAIDLNNDDRIDGYDLNGDSIIDEKSFTGYKYIYMWRVWSILLWLLLVVNIVFGIIIQRKKKGILNKI